MGRYKSILVKAWARDTLGVKLQNALKPYRPEQIVNVTVAIDFWFFVPWRRNWAMIVVHEPQDDPEG